MNNTTDYNLFSAADAAIAPFLTEFDFERSLVFNILFQDRLLLHEAYFFGSNFIAKHIKNSKFPTSLFEEASKNGIIVPAFRDKKVKTLEGSYDGMKKAYGPDFNFVNAEHTSATIYRLYDSLNQGSLGQDPFYWPEHTQLGDTLLITSGEYLCQDKLPEYLLQDSSRYKNIEKYWVFCLGYCCIC